MLFDLPAGARVPSRCWRRSLRAQNLGYAVPLRWLLAATHLLLSSLAVAGKCLGRATDSAEGRRGAAGEQTAKAVA